MIYIYIYIYILYLLLYIYFIKGTEIRFIDKTDPSDPARLEDFWIDTLKTHYPEGLNNIDPYQ